MIKFFRKIRKRMLTENKLSKYLLYAIGEIVLVVIGILIALQINNWNETNKSIEKEHKYLENIVAEIIGDSLLYERSWFRNKSRKIESLETAKRFIIDNYIPTDTLDFINNIGFGGINSRADFSGTSRAYLELLSTGNISLITNEGIRNDIVDYYNNKEFLKEYMKNIRSDYATYFNSLKVYNSRFPDSINMFEVPRILKKIKTDEFHSLINQELTFAHSIDRVLERNKSEAHNLQNRIQEFLKNKS